MGVLESTVEKLEAHNKQLVEEMRALDGRKCVLEKVLAMKDEKILQLENGTLVRYEYCVRCMQFFVHLSRSNVVH